jgi:DNA-binding response OmpR family regulator
LITVADIILDPKEKVVRRGHSQMHLTPKEARLLQLLMENAGKLVAREEIMRRVWDTEYTGDMRTIDVHVRWLRKKLEPTPGAPRYICTVRGKGYRFEPGDLDGDDSQA